MIRLKRVSVILLASVLSLAFIAPGCGKKSDEQTPKSTSQSSEPPAKLKMFFSDAGNVIPQDVDQNNEPFLATLEKLANVDLEIIRPAYQDYVTKVNLSIASGDLPDLIHCYGTIVTEVRKAGADGAFVDLEKNIKNSKLASKVYTNEMLDLMRYSTDNKIYTLMEQDEKNRASVVARVDLIRELLGDKTPITPDDWYDLAKKEKQKYPDSVPFTARGGLAWAETFFRAYGVSNIGSSGVGWQKDGAKYISGFEAPKMREAVEFYRKLYSEKLLDPTFFTNKLADQDDRLYNKNSLITVQNAATILQMMDKSLASGDKKAIWAFVPHPVAQGVKPELASYNPTPIGAHGIAISSKSKNPEAAFRVVEAFLSEDIKNMAAWGREGVEYTVKDGKKVLNNEAAQASAWRHIYAFMNPFGYTQEMLKIRAELAKPKLGSNADKFFTEYTKGLDIRDKEVYSKKIDYSTYFMEMDTNIKSMEKEALAQSISIVVKAIVNEISMDEYDKQVKDYLTKYKKVTDEYTRAFEEYNKSKK